MINAIIKNILFKGRIHMGKGIKILFILISIIAITLIGLFVLSIYYDHSESENTIDAAAMSNSFEGNKSYNALPLVYLADDKSMDNYIPNEEDIKMLAKLIWGEARGVKSVTERSAVVWCVLNRVDASEFPDTVSEVIMQPQQFVGYSKQYPITEENALIANDVLMRWHSEKEGCTNSGRTLPQDYKYFTGDGKSNYFTKDWKSSDKWNWSCISPYEN